MWSLRLLVASAAVMSLAGCPQPRLPDPVTLPAKAHGAAPQPSGDNVDCEAKDNSGGPCDPVPDPKPEKVAAAAPATAPRRPQYDPSMCNQTGPQMMLPVFAAMANGTLDDWQAYCTSIGMGPDSAGGGPVQSQPASSTVGGGCVWKGHSYQPGERIHYSQGTIYAGDLYVNGTRFDILSNLGRGPSERFQACECGSRSHVWGCV